MRGGKHRAVRCAGGKLCAYLNGRVIARQTGAGVDFGQRHLAALCGACLLLCPDAAYIDRVAAAMTALVTSMPREKVIRAALENRGALIEVRDLDEACHIANRIAPEHLELSLADADAWVDKIHHAGAIFIGPYTSESLGDYCAGPNHVLPTSGSARFSSPLGVYDFQKRSSLIRVSKTAAQTLGKVASVLARGEGLPAHAASADYRLD